MSSNPTMLNYIGESIKIENCEPLSAIKTLNGKILFCETLENGTEVLYAFSNKIPKSVKLNNQEVNIQVAHNNSYSIIGWPLILGSF